MVVPPAPGKQTRGFVKSSPVYRPPTPSTPRRKRGHHDEDSGPWSRWIDPTLSPSTRNRLCAELEKPVSRKDRPGFIYSYQLENEDAKPSSAHYGSSMYKIGRTANIARRLSQWRTRCGYRPALVECFPPSRPIRFSHRCERLIHIELSERFGAGPVLCPGRCLEAHYEWFRVRAPRTPPDPEEATVRIKAEHVGPRSGWDGTGPTTASGGGWETMRAVILKWIDFVEAGHADASTAMVVSTGSQSNGSEGGVGHAMLLGDDDDDDEFFSCEEDTSYDDSDASSQRASNTGAKHVEEDAEALAALLACMCLQDKLYDTSQPSPLHLARSETAEHTKRKRAKHDDVAGDIENEERRHSTDSSEWEIVRPSKPSP
ncbi:hypothetical protein HKX48_007687 [Thoreauomyces humboldtii]|nr:hypothetical protein HKX48_007687 [Thoreauomyces humboldtii]